VCLHACASLFGVAFAAVSSIVKSSEVSIGGVAVRLCDVTLDALRSTPPQQWWALLGWCVVLDHSQTPYLCAEFEQVLVRHSLHRLAKSALRQGQTFIAGQALQTDLTNLRTLQIKKLKAAFRALVKQEWCRLLGKSAEQMAG
jgi:hypothetical protein